MYSPESLEFVMKVFTAVIVTWAVRYPLHDIVVEWYHYLKD